MADKHTILNLLKKQVSGNRLSPEEGTTIRKWASKSETNRFTVEYCTEPFHIEEMLQEAHQYDSAGSFEAILEKLPPSLMPQYRSGSLLNRGLLAAGLIVFFLIGYTYLFSQHFSFQKVKYTRPIAHSLTLRPSTGHAILTFDDIVTVDTDTLPSFANISPNYRIYKSAAGEIEFGCSTDDQQHFATLFSGKQKSVVCMLPDGSRVFLNPSSTIRFPDHFSLYNRIVELSGEAYFNIQKDIERPFYIQILSPRDSIGQNARVEAHSGQVAVTAYPDELLVKTCAVDGDILTGRNESAPALLTPDQTFSPNRSSGVNSVTDFNQDLKRSWTNNEFTFQQVLLPVALEPFPHESSIKMQRPVYMRQDLHNSRSIFEWRMKFQAVRNGNIYIIKTVS
ncbi:MAG: FecR family protein [Puia sp.]|nr:FecR family protein [Puia sp.]